MASDLPTAPTLPAPLTRPGWAFLIAHPAHFIALGAGSGLSRLAPGTAGTLWAWAAFVVLQPALSDAAWAALIAIGTLVGWWACTVTARHMRVADSGHIVWDEIIAFWLVLWLVSPTGLLGQALAFALFLASNIAWLCFAHGRAHWGLFAQQCLFLLTSLLGLWNWWLGPLLLG